MEGWTTIERRTFTFAIPPGYERVVREIGHVGEGDEWADAAGNVVGYVRRQFADELRRYVYEPGFRSCTEEIGGRLARIVVFREQDLLFAGAHWPSDGPSGDTTFQPLTVYGYRRDREIQRLVLVMVRTVQFTPER
ncbi:MAG TPA: hypothetical protein VF192_03445 [Longimicrobiales bacterium]